MSVPNRNNTDGKEPGQWESTYEKSVRKMIYSEAWYLAIVLLLTLVAILLLCSGGLYHLATDFFAWELNPKLYKKFKLFSLSILGGMLGGIIFDIKWLIHAVAKSTWRLDRRLWRLFVPWTSGAFAFIFTALIKSEIIRIFDSQSLDTVAAALGFGFLVGYFSDNAIAKLSEVAQTIFGTLGDEKKPKEEKKQCPKESTKAESEPKLLE